MSSYQFDCIGEILDLETNSVITNSNLIIGKRYKIKPKAGESTSDGRYTADGIYILNYKTLGNNSGITSSDYITIGDMTYTYAIFTPNSIIYNKYFQYHYHYTHRSTTGGRNRSYHYYYTTENPISIVPANSTPTISPTSKLLGTFSTSPPSVNYTVYDTDNDTLTVKHLIDNVQKSSYTKYNGNTGNITISKNDYLKLLNGNHTMTVNVSDGKDNTSAVYTFTKNVNSIDIESNKMESSDRPRRGKIKIKGVFPTGCTLTAYITNNANDSVPIWEDISSFCQTGEIFRFNNRTKISTKWAVQLKVIVNKGTASLTCYINSIVGNFD